MLDNCEHVITTAAEVAEDLLRRCPALRILATSREGLRVGGETIWPVPPLAADDAVRLFVARADAAGAPLELSDDDQRGVIADICARLDGLPLAIELAAARTRAFPLNRSASGSTIGSGCSPVGRAPRCRASRRCARWSTGATSCSSTTSSESSNGCRCSPAAATWRRRRPSARTRRSPTADLADHLHALVDKSLVVAVPSGRRAAVHASCRRSPSTAWSGSTERGDAVRIRERDGEALRRAVRAERRRVHGRPAAGVADGDRPGARQPQGCARVGGRQRRRGDRTDDRRRHQLAPLAGRAW